MSNSTMEKLPEQERKMEREKQRKGETEIKKQQVYAPTIRMLDRGVNN